LDNQKTLDWDKIRIDLPEVKAPRAPWYPLIHSPKVRITAYWGKKTIISKKGNQIIIMIFDVKEADGTVYELGLPHFVVKKYIDILQGGSFRVRSEAGLSVVEKC